MTHQARRDSFPSQLAGPATADSDLAWPFGKLEGIDSDDICETAYEVFFTSCRSSPGLGGTNATSFYSSNDNNNNNKGGGDEGVGGGGGSGSGSPTARFNGFILIPILILSMQQMPFNLPANMYQKLLPTV